LIHVNNMENLARDHAAAAAGLMQDVRDCFLADHSHWLFVGTTNIEEAVFRASPQVSGIIPFAITLGPLRPDEVGELLERRYRHLQSGLRIVHPVAPDAGAALYARYHGHLRDFLSLLSNAVQRHTVLAPATPLGTDEIVKLMEPTFRADKLVRRIGEGDATHLATVLHGEPYDAEFRVAEVSKATGTTQAAASKLVRRLLDAGVIVQSRTQGQSVYYRVSHGDLTIALGLR